ncbi:hypothetical protein FOL47_002563 [Perkinsus chesapeaki]|uniref:TIR domain-containing protein n=1 Tax=Perkinsus chesapeaki TaxID=330153 RepID=A0A7J6MCU5_PERCH|nr:hypothetical protein FOL47_002563 [Perkinsus chesapeaki]
MHGGNLEKQSSINDHQMAISHGVDTQGLRACSMISIMMSNSLLGEDAAPKEAPKPSSPVDSIDIFLSHSWSASGFWKLVTLLAFFNSPSVSAVIAWSYLGALIYFSIVSTTTFNIMGVVLVHVIFLIGLCIISHVMHRNTMVFFDKCCINQLDPVLKSDGISRLSDYVRASKKLVVLWSPDYLDRMWCVYELAVFLHTHTEADITVINLRYTKLSTFVVLLKCSFGGCLSLFNMCVPHCGSEHTGLLGLLICLLLWYIDVICADEFENMRARLRTFSLSRAKPSCPIGTYIHLHTLITAMCGSVEAFEEKIRAVLSGETRTRGIQQLLSSLSV